tara:strand:- start:378 stop:1478 length:1101 start_codon:yes stop_codon:yes gene_type:complete
MADFTTADLEGANELLNKTLTDALALKDQLVASHGADATALLNSLQSKVADLESSLSNMIPELPTVPNVNMQGEFATLVNFDVTTPQGLEQFTTQTANITAQFGTAMKDKGLDIDSLATQIQTGGKDLISDLLPNLQIPDGETIPIELPANVSLPSVESVTETISKVSTDTTKLVTTEIEVITEEAGAGLTKVTKTATETKTVSTSPKTITSTVTKDLVKVTDTGGGTKTTTIDFSSTEEANKKYREDKLAEYKRNRTIIPGFYEDKTYRGVPLPIQVFDDDDVYSMEEKVNGISSGSGETYKTEYLSKAKTLRYFQSDTYDEDIKNGISEKEAFLNARSMGDWNWKEDDKDYIRYDRRFKKRRLT